MYTELRMHTYSVLETMVWTRSVLNPKFQVGTDLVNPGPDLVLLTNA